MWVARFAHFSNLDKLHAVEASNIRKFFEYLVIKRGVAGATQ